MWTPDLKTSCSTKIQASIAHSKSQSSLVSAKNEDEKNIVQQSSTKASSSSSDKPPLNKSLSSNRILESSSYADYENYFYI